VAPKSDTLLQRVSYNWSGAKCLGFSTILGLVREYGCQSISWEENINPICLIRIRLANCDMITGIVATEIKVLSNYI
jgi:hypothetical protein